MAGDDDQMVPPINARLIQALMPHAERHIFHDGHLGLLTSADEVSPVIQSFLAST
jgi:pimeloyl-ACP methyl ester carboxylesterase